MGGGGRSKKRHELQLIVKLHLFAMTFSLTCQHANCQSHPLGRLRWILRQTI